LTSETLPHNLTGCSGTEEREREGERASEREINREIHTHTHRKVLFRLDGKVGSVDASPENHKTCREHSKHTYTEGGRLLSATE